MITYSDYLQLDKLLEIQNNLSPDENKRNEQLFIIIHQAHELWFKQLILEIHELIYFVNNGKLINAINVMKRIIVIMDSLTYQISIILTLKSHEFSSFRPYLGSASGFQSYQFAGIEALLGRGNKEKILKLQSDEKIKDKLLHIISPTSLWESVCLLMTNKYDDKSVRTNTFKKILKSETTESFFLNQLLDLDSLLQKWRYSHINLVERTIGLSKGTGGSSGADYLKSTVFYHVFDELWDCINS